MAYLQYGKPLIQVSTLLMSLQTL